MPRKCVQCNEVYSLRRTQCPRCQSPDSLILSGGSARLTNRSLTGYALLAHGLLLAFGVHPEACLPAVALGILLVAGIDHAVAWTRLAGVLTVIGGPLAACLTRSPAPALIGLFALLCLWLLKIENQDRVRVACIALVCYYAAYICIILVLPHH
jgi:hypothetical protein